MEKTRRTPEVDIAKEQLAFQELEQFYVSINGAAALPIGPTRKPDYVKAQQITETFYALGTPMQYEFNGKRRAIRTGDSVFRKEGKLYSAESDSNGKLTFHELTELENTSCIDTITTPKQLIDVLYKIRECYKWGDMDCAKVMSRVLRMAGEHTPESASDIVDHFLHRQGKFNLDYQKIPKKKRRAVYEKERKQHFLAADGFDKLKPGIYYADMGPVHKDGTYGPIHGLTIIVGENGELSYNIDYR